GIADSTAPVPRFIVTTPGADCTALRDCNAGYFPHVAISPASVTFSGVAGGGGRAQYVQIYNSSGGILGWQAAIDYASGGPTGWVQIAPVAGVGNGSIYVYVDPSQLSVGTYQASLNIAAGPNGTPAALAITFNVAAPPPPPAPTISGITSAANFQLKAVAPGSLATVFGANFGASGASVTFGGMAATILFQNAAQLNVLVPASLANQTSTQVIVTANAENSAPATVELGQYEPAIFAGGVLNQDSSLNSKSNPAGPGSIIQIFATGLSGPGVIEAKIGSAPVNYLEYSGPAPGLIGVQQVNLQIPQNTSASSVAISVCGALPGLQGPCSAAYTVYVGR
ncbi:MAG: IPT/TIG domain-containing protein, partial [Bryobacteraceae bacterium]